MTNQELDFDAWFDHLKVLGLDGSGGEFRDRDSVQGDYENGRDVHDVADEIIAEYNDD